MYGRITFWLTFLSVITSGYIHGQYINEFHYNNIGASIGEFVEVFFPDPQLDYQALIKYRIYLYRGEDSLTYLDRGLQGIQAGCDVEAGGCYYIWEQQAAFIQDGPRDGIALVHEAIEDTIVFEFISYDGTLEALDGPAIGVTSTDIGISEDNNTPVGWSLQRRDDSTWFAGPATKGYVNPIELLSFSGRYMEDKQGVLLEWSTASELNNHYFQVQRSLDQRSFQTVGEVAGAGNSQEILQYSFFDTESYQGVVYYRLKQVDFGNTYTYSPVIAIQSTSSTELAQIGPILRGRALYFKNSGYRHALVVSLYDNVGRLLLYRKSVHSGDVIQINTFGNGIIFFHIRSQGQTHSGPLLIIDH